MKISREKIELIQAQKGMSASVLANRSGISRQSISTIKGRGTCTPTTAAKLAKGLGVFVSDITDAPTA